MDARLNPVRPEDADSVTAGYLQRAAATYGAVPAPMTMWAHSPAVLASIARLEAEVASTWRALDQELIELAVLRTAQLIGCPWCIDFGSYLAERRGISAEKLSHVGQWQQSELFSGAERDVLEYAEQMAQTPPRVSDRLVARLRGELDDGQFVELTMFIALEHMRSRFNDAIGLGSQGFQTAPNREEEAQ